MNTELRYCCVFRLGNTLDLIEDHGVDGFSYIITSVVENMRSELGVEIYVRELIDRVYYYCYLDIGKLNTFRMQVYKYRGKGVIVLYGIQIYYTPLPTYILGGQDLVVVNLLLSSIIQLNKHTANVKPVRRMRKVNGEVEVYNSYCN